MDQAGGSKRSFELVDQNKDGMVTRTELIRFGSSARFLDTTRRYVDFNKDNKLTPRDFRSPAGVRVLRFEF
jgi:Ca2+-binding EF-hand superfamily protein